MEEGGSPYTRKRGRGVWHIYSWLRRGGGCFAIRGEEGRLWQNKARTVKKYLKMYDSHFLSTWFSGIIALDFFYGSYGILGGKLPLPPPPGPVPWRFSVDRKRTKPWGGRLFSLSPFLALGVAAGQKRGGVFDLGSLFWRVFGFFFRHAAFFEERERRKWRLAGCFEPCLEYGGASDLCLAYKFRQSKKSFRNFDFSASSSASLSMGAF